MEKRFLEFCEKQYLFTPHRRVLVALSGGLDSMNLYELLYKNKERYDFFKQIMEKEDCTALVTGHHANDQAETTFMRLIRGTKLRHLSGIPVRQPFGKGELIRPLLTFTKDELMKIPHFEDSSNDSQDYFRNRVRHQYLPEFEKENPQMQASLRYLAEEVNRWHQALKELTS